MATDMATRLEYGGPMATGAVTLSSNDPEPPEGTIVRDSQGKLWSRDDGEYGGPGRANWLFYGADWFAGADPESWIKVAGNYGPVEVVEEPQP